MNSMKALQEQHGLTENIKGALRLCANMIEVKLISEGLSNEDPKASTGQQKSLWSMTNHVCK